MKSIHKMLSDFPVGVLPDRVIFTSDEALQRFLDGRKRIGNMKVKKRKSTMKL